MQKRISWKKGMRLSDDIMKASDEAKAEWVRYALVIASAGRFGLFPGQHPFQISVDISNGFAEIVALNCLAVTKNGCVIDIRFDSKYTNTTESRVPMPNDGMTQELFLTVGVKPDQWKENPDGFEEQSYEFNIVKPNTPIPDNTLPIAHLVNTDYGGWHVDDIDFVPPCLFVSSHRNYEELLTQFLQVMTEIEGKAHGLINSDAREAVKVFWPVAQQIIIDTDRGRDLLTPMALLGNIQKFVSIFTAACEIDEYLNLSDADAFRSYAMSPYNYKNVYQKAKEGLGICVSINEKIGKIQAGPTQPKTVPAPYINDKYLLQNCKSLKASIPVTGSSTEALVFYSIDGTDPNRRLPDDGMIMVETGFNKKKQQEPDRTIIVKLKAVDNGVSSTVATFTVTLHKDYKLWDGYEI